MRERDGDEMTFVVQLRTTHEALSLFPRDIRYNILTNIYRIPLHYLASFVQYSAFVDDFSIF